VAFEIERLNEKAIYEKSGKCDTKADARKEKYFFVFILFSTIRAFNDHHGTLTHA
jgi:hypothetical protein